MQQSPVVIGINSTHPLSTDDYDQHVRTFNRRPDAGAEVYSGCNRCDVYEDATFAEFGGSLQPFLNSPGVGCCTVSFSVLDEEKPDDAPGSLTHAWSQSEAPTGE